MGKELLLNGVAVEMRAIGTPGMIFGRRLGDLNDLVDIFGIDRLGLVGQFFVGCVSERFVIVENRDNSFCIFADSDLGVTQGIVRAAGLDLIDDLVGLDGEVFGEQA